MNHSLVRIAARAAIVLSLLLSPSFAFADEAAAETLFQEGLSAMKRGDFIVACEAFSSSNKADPSPGTQINLALCFEKQKKWASAWTWYRSAVGLAQQRNQKEREQLADESATRLKSQLHYVIVAISEPLDGVVVRRDGAEVTVALAGKEVPLPIDPGEHTLEVTASGRKPWTHKFQVADNNQTDRINVPKLEVEQKAGETPGGEYHPPVVVTSDGSGQRTVGIVVGAAGLLAGLAGVGTFILAKSEESKRQDARDQAAATADEANRKLLDDAAKSHQSAAENDQLIAIILGASSAVLIGVGAVLYFTAPKKSATARVVPLLGPSFGGAGLTGTF